jgi:hypothetical protein
MSQSPQSHMDAIPRLHQESQGFSMPVLEASPKPNYSIRRVGSLWRAGIVIGILLFLSVSQGAAAPPQPSPAPKDKAAPATPAAKPVSPTVVNLKTSLQNVLCTLRDAKLQKDFDKYVSVYARRIRGNNMVRFWDRYDTIKNEVAIDKIESIDPENAIAFVTWYSENRDRRTGKVSSDTYSERILFTRKNGKWLILPDEDVP